MTPSDDVKTKTVLNAADVLPFQRVLLPKFVFAGATRSDNWTIFVTKGDYWYGNRPVAGPARRFP